MKNILIPFFQLLLNRARRRNLYFLLKFLAVLAFLVCCYSRESMKEKRYRAEYCNDNFLNMVGLQKNEVEGKLIHSVLPNITHKLISKYEEAIHTKKPTRYDPTHITPIGPLSLYLFEFG